MRTAAILMGLAVAAVSAPAWACMSIPASVSQLRGADVVATGRFEKVVKSVRRSKDEDVTAYRFKVDRLIRDQTRLGVTLPVENVHWSEGGGCAYGAPPPDLDRPVLVYLRLDRQNRTWFDLVEYRYTDED